LNVLISLGVILVCLYVDQLISKSNGDKYKEKYFESLLVEKNKIMDIRGYGDYKEFSIFLKNKTFSSISEYEMSQMVVGRKIVFNAKVIEISNKKTVTFFSGMRYVVKNYSTINFKRNDLVSVTACVRSFDKKSCLSLDLDEVEIN